MIRDFVVLRLFLLQAGFCDKVATPLHSSRYTMRWYDMSVRACVDRRPQFDMFVLSALAPWSLSQFIKVAVTLFQWRVAIFECRDLALDVGFWWLMFRWYAECCRSLIDQDWCSSTREDCTYATLRNVPENSNGFFPSQKEWLFAQSFPSKKLWCQVFRWHLSLKSVVHITKTMMRRAFIIFH